MELPLKPENIVSLGLSILFFASAYLETNALLTGLIGVASLSIIFLNRGNPDGARKERYFNLMSQKISTLTAIAAFNLLPEIPVLASLILILGVSTNSLENLTNFKVFQQTSNQKTLAEVRTGLLISALLTYPFNPLITVYLTSIAAGYEFFHLLKKIYGNARTQPY